MLPTSAAYFACFFGVLLAGGVPVPIYPPARKAQLEDHLRRQSGILRNSGVVQLITVTEAVSVAKLLGNTVASLRQVLDAATLESRGSEVVLGRKRPDELAFLQYTSGSTGDPKGVMLSHANVIANIRADGHGMHVAPGDTFVSWLPLYHDMGLIGAWLGSLYHGVHLVVMSPLAFLSRPARWLQAISRYHGNISAAPNFAYELCIKRIQDHDLEGVRLNSWRIAANGAEAISAATMNSFCSKFAPYGFDQKSMFPVYGLAECSVGLSFPPPGRGPIIERISRSGLARKGVATPITEDVHSTDEFCLVGCGSPLPAHQLRIVDKANQEVPERTEGRIQFCGPSATTGYFDRPEATASLFCDGWLETGDRGYITGGELFITGRTKDIIIRAGRNIYPAEFEDAVGDLEGVRKGHVAVFGSSDPQTGTERVVVLAESRKRGDEQQSDLRDAIMALGDERLGLPPDEVVLVSPNTVLRTSSGKVRRDACRQLYENKQLVKKPAPPWLQLTRLFLGGIAPRITRQINRIGARLFALYAWSVFALFAVPTYISACLPLPLAQRWCLARLSAKFAASLVLSKARFEGEENLPKDGAPAVLVINHQSYLDGPIAFALLPKLARFMIKADLGSSWLLRVPLQRLGMLFIERFNAAGGFDGLKTAADTLQRGHTIAMFPEGTFRRMPGLLPFRMGPFALAAQCQVPVIPVVLRGTRNVLRDGTWAPRRGEVVMRVGEHITPDATLGEWQSALQLRDKARAFMTLECGEPDLAHESNEPPLKLDD
jgi:1-acyl-sn-glycerol-3-phosphate acyltransferase